jgi:hypothetical protein
MKAAAARAMNPTARAARARERAPTRAGRKRTTAAPATATRKVANSTAKRSWVEEFDNGAYLVRGTSVGADIGNLEPRAAPVPVAPMLLARPWS